jgi:hypothetical protein
VRHLTSFSFAAGALLVAAAGPVASQGGGPGGGEGTSGPAGSPSPAIAQVVDVPPGGGGQPVRALWRDAAVPNRVHVVLDPTVDAMPWRIVLGTERWAPDELRVVVTFDEGGAPVGKVTLVEGAEPRGTAAALTEDDGLAVDVPGIPSAGALIRASMRDRVAEGAIDLVLSPAAVDGLAAVPEEGLRSPAEVVLFGADDAPSLTPTQAPQGPALRRTNAGIRISMPDPVPTTANGLTVTSVIDRVFVRGGDDLLEPILASLVITSADVRLLDGVGQQLPSPDNPWSVPFTTTDGGVPSADVSLTELGELVGAPLTGSARVGMLRILELDDGTRLIGDGLDARIDALPSVAGAPVDANGGDGRAANGDDDAQPMWRTALPVIIGLIVVGAVLAPGIWFRIQDRRLRRSRDH